MSCATGRSVLSPLSPLLRDDAGNGDNLTDGDDEILESLVKTATKMPSTRTVPRERKRTRHADRKSREYFGGAGRGSRLDLVLSTSESR